MSPRQMIRAAWPAETIGLIAIMLVILGVAAAAALSDADGVMALFRGFQHVR